MTKLVTAVAVMQLVERGLISLDDDAREIIPELKDMKVFENGSKGMIFCYFLSAPLIVKADNDLDTNALNAPRLQDMSDRITVR